MTWGTSENLRQLTQSTITTRKETDTSTYKSSLVATFSHMDQQDVGRLVPGKNECQIVYVPICQSKACKKKRTNDLIISYKNLHFPCNSIQFFS